MILTIPPQTQVFRLRRPEKAAGPWHLTKKIVPNGFSEKGLHNTQTGQTDYPEWLNTSTYRAICGHAIDERITLPGPCFDGTLEVSTVGEIGKICPSCYPFDTLVSEILEDETHR